MGPAPMWGLWFLSLVLFLCDRSHNHWSHWAPMMCPFPRSLSYVMDPTPIQYVPTYATGPILGSNYYGMGPIVRPWHWNGSKEQKQNSDTEIRPWTWIHYKGKATITLKRDIVHKNGTDWLGMETRNRTHHIRTGLSNSTHHVIIPLITYEWDLCHKNGT